MCPTCKGKGYLDKETDICPQCNGVVLRRRAGAVRQVPRRRSAVCPLRRHGRPEGRPAPGRPSAPGNPRRQVRRQGNRAVRQAAPGRQVPRLLHRDRCPLVPHGRGGWPECPGHQAHQGSPADVPAGLGRLSALRRRLQFLRGDDRRRRVQRRGPARRVDRRPEDSRPVRHGDLSRHDLRRGQVERRQHDQRYVHEGQAGLLRHDALRRRP